MTYYAIFDRRDFSFCFPFLDIIGIGENMDDMKTLAKSSLDFHLKELADDGIEPPTPRSREDVENYARVNDEWIDWFVEAVEI